MFGFWAVEVAEDAVPAEIVQLGGELRNVVAADAKDLKAALSAAVEGDDRGEGDFVAA